MSTSAIAQQVKSYPWYGNATRRTRPRPRRKVRALTEWQIQRRIERYKGHLAEMCLYGGAATRACVRDHAKDAVRAVETLLRAGVVPSRGMMGPFPPEEGPVSSIIAQTLSPVWRKVAKYEFHSEANISYRAEYSMRFYGVRP
jgi:hypothetical protein